MPIRRASGKVTAVGFCFGGRYVFLLGQSTSPVQVDVAVSYHPSLLSVPTDFENLSVPVYLGHGTADNFVTNDQEIESALIQAVGREKLLFERYEDAAHGYVQVHLGVPLITYARAYRLI